MSDAAGARTLLSMSCVDKSFRVGSSVRTVLRALSMTMKRGEFLAVTGPPQSGKTTIARIIGLLDTPSVGEYEVNGMRVFGLSDAQRTTLRNVSFGFVMGPGSLAHDATVLENVGLPLRYRDMRSSQRQSHSSEVLLRLGIGELARKYPRNLTEHERNRVLIARALVGDPLLVIADSVEMIGSADAVSDVLTLLATANTAGTAVMVLGREHSIAAHATRHLAIQDTVDATCLSEVPRPSRV